MTFFLFFQIFLYQNIDIIQNSHTLSWYIHIELGIAFDVRNNIKISKNKTLDIVISFKMSYMTCCMTQYWLRKRVYEKYMKNQILLASKHSSNSLCMVVIYGYQYKVSMCTYMGCKML